MQIQRIGNAKLITGDNVEALRQFPDDFVDLTVTSPPYDNLRTYNGFTWDFEALAKELYRVTKPGGVVVWNVNDATVNGSETLTSFRQAIYFKDVCGFNVHDTMIYEKSGFANPSTTRYHQVFEYVFILSKGKPKSVNLIRDRANKYVGIHGGEKSFRDEFGIRFNIFRYANGKNNSTSDVNAFDHPAIMPEALANDHIISWSNEGDVVLDPFMGSGTTGKMALLNNRRFIGVELSPEYVEIAKKRIEDAKILVDSQSQ